MPHASFFFVSCILSAVFNEDIASIILQFWFDPTFPGFVHLKKFDRKVRKISFGHRHCIFSAKVRNDLYFYGSNRFGQLGFGMEREVRTPRLHASEFVDGSTVLDFGCGLNFSCISTTTGVLFSGLYDFNPVTEMACTSLSIVSSFKRLFYAPPTRLSVGPIAFVLCYDEVVSVPSTSDMHRYMHGTKKRLNIVVSTRLGFFKSPIQTIYGRLVSAGVGSIASVDPVHRVLYLSNSVGRWIRIPLNRVATTVEFDRFFRIRLEFGESEILFIDVGPTGDILRQRQQCISAIDVGVRHYSEKFLVVDRCGVRTRYEIISPIAMQQCDCGLLRSRRRHRGCAILARDFRQN